jgi:hypothetical protein
LVLFRTGGSGVRGDTGLAGDWPGASMAAERHHWARCGGSFAFEATLPEC